MSDSVWPVVVVGFLIVLSLPMRMFFWIRRFDRRKPRCPASLTEKIVCHLHLGHSDDHEYWHDDIHPTKWPREPGTWSRDRDAMKRWKKEGRYS